MNYRTRTLFRLIVPMLLCLHPLLLAGEPSQEPRCPICPQPKMFNPADRVISLGSAETAVIAIPAEATPPVQYAGQRLQTLIKNRFGRVIPIETSSTPLKESVSQVFDLRVDANAGTESSRHPNGYSIRFQLSKNSVNDPGGVNDPGSVNKPDGINRITIVGSDEPGLIYGCEALFNLIRFPKKTQTNPQETVSQQTNPQEAVPYITVASVEDWPSIRWRGRPHSVMAHQLLPGQLDAYVHARINFGDYRDNPDVGESLTQAARKSSMGCPPGKPVDQKLARQVLDEFHRRAMFVYGVVSCNLPEGNYDPLTDTFDELLSLGCDGIWVSMDDTGGGNSPVSLIEFVSKYMVKHGKTGHEVAFTPPPAEYQNIDRPLNRAIAQVQPFNAATWFFTRVPCEGDRLMAEEIGLKNLPGWWYNYCEVAGVDPKAGFCHSSAILTTQRKNGRVSYMNLLPITPGWGLPQFDSIRDAAANTDHVLLWALCGGWPAEYAISMFGFWAWSPETADWPTIRDAIYDHVWGTDQVETARTFDEKFARLKELYLMPKLWSFRTPDNSLVRLKSVSNRAEALELLDQLDALAQTLAEAAPRQTALDSQRLWDFYIEPMTAAIAFARKQATLEYPEYEFANFEIQAATIAEKQSVDDANAYLADVRRRILPMLDRISDELSELKDIEPVLDSWRTRLDKCRNVEQMNQTKLEQKKQLWEKQVRLPVKDILPFLKQPLEGNLTALFANTSNPPQAAAGEGAIRAEYTAGDWQASPVWTRGPFLTGKYNREGQQAAAIVLPRYTKTNIGDFGAVEMPVPRSVLKSATTEKSDTKKIVADIFIADSRTDNAYPNVRFIRVSVDGKQVFERDIAQPNAPDWVTIDLTPYAHSDESAQPLVIRVEVVERHPVSEHTSWVFVGPVRIR